MNIRLKHELKKNNTVTPYANAIVILRYEFIIASLVITTTVGVRFKAAVNTEN